jgi:hypothetical protein
MKKYLLLALSLLTFSSFAQTATPKSVVALKWSIPTQRENGKALPSTEVAGYEIQYKSASSQQMQKVLVVGGSATSYDLELPTIEAYDIYISAYDTKGLFSVGLKVTYTPETSPPKMKDFSIAQKFIDPQTSCTVELLCKLVKF